VSGLSSSTGAVADIPAARVIPATGNFQKNGTSRALCGTELRCPSAGPVPEAGV
jgi:hypothetical protein